MALFMVSVCACACDVRDGKAREKEGLSENDGWDANFKANPHRA